MKILVSCVLLFVFAAVSAQPVTGVWRGKITNGTGLRAVSCKVELKLIKTGDSLVGTAYYYGSGSKFTRYSVKGFFDARQNEVHWYDDKLVDVKPEGKLGEMGVFDTSMVANADFNCPGNNIMMLDGQSQIGTDGPKFTLHFDKVDKPLFKDEWDNVIEGYFTGMADPAIIDSVYTIAKPYFPEQRTDIARNGKDKKNNKKDNAAPGQSAVVKDEPGGQTAATSGTGKPEVVEEKPIAVKSEPAKAEATVAKQETVKTPVPESNKTADSSRQVEVAKNINPLADKDSVRTTVVPPPVITTAKVVAEPKIDSSLIARKDPPKVATDTVAKTVVITEQPKAVIAKNEVPPAPKPEKPVVNSQSKDSVKQTVAVVPVQKPVEGQAAVKKPVEEPAANKIAKQVPTQQDVVQKPVTQSPVITEKKSDTQPAATTAARQTTPVTQQETAKTVTQPKIVPEKKPAQPAPATVAKQAPVAAPQAVVQKPVVPPAPVKTVTADPPKPNPVVAKADPPKPAPIVIKTDPVAEQLFVTRQKINQGEIPIAGDSVELNFYDNAEVDGDSIALFLNGKLLFSHVLLNTKAHTFKIATADLPDGSELTMVAENLGTIPPNTALMLAYVEGQRYSARIESTEKTSGVIKLVRRK